MVPGRSVKAAATQGFKHVLPTTVAKIESGERWVRLAEANALADVFEVSVDVLLGEQRTRRTIRRTRCACWPMPRTGRRTSVYEIAATLAEQLHDMRGMRRCRPTATAPGMRCETRTRHYSASLDR